MYSTETKNQVKRFITENPDVLSGYTTFKRVATNIHIRISGISVAESTIAKIVGQLYREGVITRNSRGSLAVNPKPVNTVSELKPGMKVRITKSRRNWNKKMDKYVGQVHIIGEVTNKDTGRVRFKDANAALNSWSWVYTDGHFEVLANTPKLKVGMRVRITKGWDCWNDKMDKYVGKEYVIESLMMRSPNDEKIQCAKFECSSSVNDWCWYIDFGHFVVIDEPCTKAPITGDVPTTDHVPTKEQILKAASTSPEAEKALKELFPAVFVNPWANLVSFEDETCDGWYTHTNGLDQVFKGLKKEGDAARMMVGVGMAPKEELMYRIAQPNKNMDLVIFDSRGNEVYRLVAGDGWFGFEKKVTK